MRSSDDRYAREQREHDLAVWMISYGARTHTITQWTGLQRHRIQQLSRRYQNTAPGDHRRRGVSPSQSAYFGKSLRLEAESLALAFAFHEMRVIPDSIVTDARRCLPELARGERLKMAYELYRQWMPQAQISLERAILFVIELAERRNWFLRHCRTCPDVMVVDRLGVQHDQCPFCRSERRGASKGDESPVAER